MVAQGSREWEPLTRRSLPQPNDRLTPEEYQRLQEQNTAYRKKFGFPFLYAVKGSTKYDILRALDQRLKSPPSDEFHQALNQVYRIALFRLQDTIAHY